MHSKYLYNIIMCKYISRFCAYEHTFNFVNIDAVSRFILYISTYQNIISIPTSTNETGLDLHMLINIWHSNPKQKPLPLYSVFKVIPTGLVALRCPLTLVHTWELQWRWFLWSSVHNCLPASCILQAAGWYARNALLSTSYRHVWLRAYPWVWTMTIKAPATGLPISPPQNFQNRLLARPTTVLDSKRQRTWWEERKGGEEEKSWEMMPAVTKAQSEEREGCWLLGHWIKPFVLTSLWRKNGPRLLSDNRKDKLRWVLTGPLVMEDKCVACGHSVVTGCISDVRHQSHIMTPGNQTPHRRPLSCHCSRRKH